MRTQFWKKKLTPEHAAGILCSLCAGESMKELRNFLGLLFGFVAFSCASMVLVPIFRSIHGLQLGEATRVLLGSIHFVVVFMLACSLLNGMACWAVLTHGRFARSLGITASMLPFAGLVFITIISFAFHSYGSFAPLTSMAGVTLALAAAGGIAFVPRRTAQALAKQAASTPGDGTARWSGKVVWVIGFIGFVVCFNWWVPWAKSQGLAWGGNGVSLYAQAVLADLAVVLLHELGHTLTGLALGMKLRAFIVGPFQWQFHDGKWGFKFRPAAFFSSGGTTGLVPSNPRQPVAEEICMIAAGPFASLTTGILTLCAALTAPGRSWESASLFLALVATLSLMVGVLNLVPFQTTSASYSDGAQIYQLLSGGPQADYHRAVAIVASSLVTPLRPREYDVSVIHRASLGIPNGQRGMMLHLHASAYYMDNASFAEAGDATARAEAVYNDCALDIPAGLHTAFVFRKAFLHRDAAGARVWWERMEAKRNTRQNVDYWRARAALLWIEGSLEEAWGALEQAEDYARRLPGFGAYEFDRYLCGLLREALGKNLETKSRSIPDAIS